MIIWHFFLLNIDYYFSFMKLLYHSKPLLREVTFLVFNLFTLTRSCLTIFTLHLRLTLLLSTCDTLKWGALSRARKH